VEARDIHTAHSGTPCKFWAEMRVAVATVRMELNFIFAIEMVEDQVRWKTSVESKMRNGLETWMWL
jgi:hypothetical protein